MSYSIKSLLVRKQKVTRLLKSLKNLERGTLIFYMHSIYFVLLKKKPDKVSLGNWLRNGGLNNINKKFRLK